MYSETSLGTNSVLERYRSDLFLLNRGWCETTVQLATTAYCTSMLMIFIIYLYCGYNQVTERIASFTRMTCRVRYYKSICGSFRNFNRVKINGTYQHCILLHVGTKPALCSSMIMLGLL